MSVFFVHDVGKGIVTPLDRKFRVRDIQPTDELSETQKVHDKLESNPEDFQFVQGSAERQRNPNSKDDTRQQQAAQAYQVNQPRNLNLGFVKDIMSAPVLSIAKDKYLSDAWRIMRKYEIHHLVILDDAQNYCGMLSEKIIIPFLMDKLSDESAEFTDVSLDVFCQQSLLSTRPETSISELAPALLEYGLDAIAVFANQQIVGIVTNSDILKLILKQQSLNASA